MSTMWTILLTTMAMVFGAEEVTPQACFVYPLCTCSQAWRELGEVTCVDVPFTTLPKSLSGSIMHSLTLRRNGLRQLAEFNLSSTRLFRLEVRENQLTHLKSNSLGGLEQRLRQLDLSSNKISTLPTDAIRNLEKLESLDLSDNFISDIRENDLAGKYKKTLKRLNLAGNSITLLREGCLGNLVSLEDLDLSSNLIHDVTTDPGPNNLRKLSLADNQLSKIPFEAISNKKTLDYVDLSDNRIFTTYDSAFSDKITLKEIHLERNYISILSINAFKNFKEAEKLYLDGNLIREVKANAFRDVQVLELYLRDSLVYSVSPHAFRGQEESLSLIDLSRNNLSTFPEYVLENLTDLKSLNLEGNRNLVIENNSFKDARFNLEELNLERIRDSTFSIEDIAKIQELKSFQMTREYRTKRRDDDIFEYFGPQLESLSLVNAFVVEIQEDSFDETPRLKFLDLSMNRIEIFHRDAFKPISQSLQVLNLHRALGNFQIPHEALRDLEEITDLDLSENFISQLRSDSFSNLKKLEFLNLNFNILRNVDKGVFEDINNPNLQHLSVSFNKIQTVQTDTFEGLNKLSILLLNDNSIREIEKEAFSNLESLTELDLEGNYLDELVNDTFHNLPRLQFLNLAHNNLNRFNYYALENVGNLNSLMVDLRYNNINRLDSNSTNSHSYLSVEELDTSWNNISFINASYFAAFKSSLLVLKLNRNAITTLNYSVFYHLEYLQSLDLSENGLEYLSELAFGGLSRLRVLNVSYNDLTDIAPRTLAENEHLNVLDVSYNLLEVFPEDCFRSTKLEWLNAANNEILRFPDMALLSVRRTLKHLDLSNNKIRSLSPQDVENLEQLVHFDISFNNIKMMQSQTLTNLQNLVHLDLSNNPFQNLDETQFEDLGNNLEILNLAATNLTSFPSLTLPRLETLNLSNNAIAFITPQSLINITKVRELDLSGNNLVSAPNSAWHSLPKLRWLKLSSNPIAGFSNDSYIGLERLEALEMTNLPLQFLQKGAFRPLVSLRYLRVDAYPKLTNYILPIMLAENHALKHIHIELDETDLGNLLQGLMNKNVDEVTLEGPGLRSFNADSFKCFQGSKLSLNLHRTNVTELPSEMFGRLGFIRDFTMDARDNMIRGIPVHKDVITNEIQPLEHLKTVLISGNPLQCDCHLAWLDRWYRNLYNRDFDSRNIKDADNIRRVTADLRMATCANKGDRPLLEVFKNDFNCQYSQHYGSAASNTGTDILIFVLAIIVMAIVK